MSEREWHIDVARNGNRELFLVVFDPATERLERQRISNASRIEIVKALRTIMLRTVPEFPDVIVTDHANYWFGVADALGVKRSFGAVPSQAERLARTSIATDDQGEGGDRS